MQLKAIPKLPIKMASFENYMYVQCVRMHVLCTNGVKCTVGLHCTIVGLHVVVYSTLVWLTKVNANYTILIRIYAIITIETLFSVSHTF